MRSRTAHALVFAIAFLFTTVGRGARAADVYEGDGLKMTVDRTAADGSWSGTLALGGTTYPFSATAQRAAEGASKLTGSFTDSGDAFPFSAEQGADGAISLSTGGTTYRLRPASPMKPNPLAREAKPAPAAGAAAAMPEELKVRKVEFRDVDMGNAVACSMLVPEGWEAKGQVKWSQGDIIYPQKNIEVSSPQGYKISFHPAMYFHYSETDPAWLAQINQLGVPHQLKERDGVPPPQDVGQWLGAYVAENDPTVKNVKLVRQDRDRPLEEAMKRAFPQNNQIDSRVLVLGYEYDDTDQGRRMHDEITVTVNFMPPMDGHPTRYWMWQLYINGVVSAPAEQFERAKPLLYAIARTLRESPQWWNATQQTLLKISEIRHKAEMDRIAAWGAAMRQAGQTYSQISDDQMASWKQRNATSDEIQRKSINAINETEDYQLPAGQSVKLPSLYDNVYKIENQDDYYLLTNKIVDSPYLKKLEPVK